MLKVNIDTHSELADEFQVSDLPTFVYLKDGKKVERSVGANADAVEELIKKIIAMNY